VKRSRSFAYSSLRVAALTTGFAFAWAGVVASCSSAPRGNVSAKNDANAKVDASPSCPVRTDVSRCSGNDPTFVFFPPLSCDPSSRGDGGLANATPDGNASTDAADDPAVDASSDGGDDAGVDASSDGGDDAGGDASSDGGDDAGVDAIANAAAGVMDPCALVTSLDAFFTPQACQAFVGAEANRNLSLPPGASVPVMDEPADGDMLTPDNWSIFTWFLIDRDSRRDWLERVVGAVEPSAYAYSPLRGDAYVLEFTQGCTEILRVMLAETAWLPDPASWALLTSLTGPVQVRVFWMQFAGDTLISTPVPSAPITITMRDARD
jgi:hypothetical protein